MQIKLSERAKKAPVDQLDPLKPALLETAVRLADASDKSLRFSPESSMNIN